MCDCTNNLCCPLCAIQMVWSYIRNGWYCKCCDIAIVEDHVIYAHDFKRYAKQ